LGVKARREEARESFVPGKNPVGAEESVTYSCDLRRTPSNVYGHFRYSIYSV
jgi:hypothetical protein